MAVEKQLVCWSRKASLDRFLSLDIQSVVQPLTDTTECREKMAGMNVDEVSSMLVL